MLRHQDFEVFVIRCSYLFLETHLELLTGSFVALHNILDLLTVFMTMEHGFILHFVHKRLKRASLFNYLENFDYVLQIWIYFKVQWNVLLKLFVRSLLHLDD